MSGLIVGLWRQQPGDYFCVSTKQGGQWKDHFFARGDLVQVTAKSKQWAKQGDVYFCPHGYSRPRRLKQFAVLGTLLWADLDYASPRDLKYPPTVQIESSPGRWAGLWVLSEGQATESLNKRMTYFSGADKGGWDVTQVLRMPGTINWKYPDRPQVHLRGEGKAYTYRQLDAWLPRVEGDDEGSVGHDGREVWLHYSKKAPRALRALVQAKRRIVGQDRSTTLGQLWQGLLDLGMTVDEAVSVAMGTVWAKNDEAWMRKDAERVFVKSAPKLEKKAERKERAEARSESKPSASTGGSEFTLATDLRPRRASFLWYPYLVRNEMNLVDGMPNRGKTFLMTKLAAHVTLGEDWPDGEKCPRGNVLYITSEDDPEYTILPRFSAHGGDVRRLYVNKRTLNIDEDAESIEKMIKQTEAKLLIIDPLSSFLGGNLNEGKEVRPRMDELNAICKETGCTAVLVRHTTKKAGNAIAINMGMGSAEVIAAVRSGLLVLPDKDNDMDNASILVHSKHNLSKRGKNIGYYVEGFGRDTDPVLRWNTEVLDGSADDMVAGYLKSISGTGDGGSKGRPSKGEPIREFLKAQLANGRELTFDRLVKLAETSSVCSERSLQRRMKELADEGVVERTRHGVYRWVGE